MILSDAKTYFHTVDFMSEQTKTINYMIKKISNLLKLKHFVLSHVEHTRQNTLVALSREMDTAQYWVEQGMPLPLILPNGFYLASQFKGIFPEHILTTLREKYAVDHYMFYVQHNHGSTDMFSLGADPDHTSVLNDYINHSQTIRRLLLNFKQDAKKLLHAAKKHAFEYDFGLAAQKALFPKKLYIPDYNGFCSLSDIAGILSKREFESLKLYARSMSKKSIAQKFKISPRTIETYLINAQNKLNCQNTDEMLDLYHTLNNLFE